MPLKQYIDKYQSYDSEELIRLLKKANPNHTRMMALLPFLRAAAAEKVIDYFSHEI